jgi:hypothetical protein
VQSSQDSTSSRFISSGSTSSMSSQFNPDSVMRNPNSSGQRPASATGYAPSVPISVYRELAAELQATKTLLDSLNNQNQQLTQQNQQLRQELERVVQAALNSQQVANSLQVPGWGAPPPPAPSHAHPSAHPEVQAESIRPVPRTQRMGRSNPKSEPKPAKRPSEPQILSEERFTEQPELNPRIQRQGTTAKEMGGFWLTLLIAAIVITAFGAGFMVVRPLLSPNR